MSESNRRTVSLKKSYPPRAHQFALRSALTAALTCCGLALTGCGVGTTLAPVASTAANSGAAGHLQGRIFGGNQPVVGASVMLYAVGTSGYGSAATPLMANPVISDKSGQFDITGTYTCPSAGTAFGPQTPVYLVARGGNPGLPSPVTSNPALALAAGLGACNSLGAATTINLNEVSTVSLAWALAQFTGANGNIGASATNGSGITNAFLNLNNLVDLALGTSPGSTAPANLTVPSSKINTLADSLAGCVNSDGTGSCPALFQAATPPGGSAPGNTLDSAFNIVRNPGANVEAIFRLAPPVAPFQPILANTPADWTLTVTVAGGGMISPTGVSIDAGGNVWVADYSQVLHEFSPAGAALYPSGITGSGLSNSFFLTIDPTNNIWVSNQNSATVNNGAGTVSEFTDAGVALSGSDGFYQGNLYFPGGIAADTNGDIWILNYVSASATLYQHPNSGINPVYVPNSGVIVFPIALAIGTDHTVWVGESGANVVDRIAPGGASVTRVTCCSSAAGLAVDQGGNIWTANYGNSSLSELSQSGVLKQHFLTGGGLYKPQGIAIDGSGNIWLGNQRSATGGVSEFAGELGSKPVGTPLSPSAGWGADIAAVEPYGVAIDASGNLWVSQFGNGTLTEMIGMATPVLTPTVVAPQLP